MFTFKRNFKCLRAPFQGLLSTVIMQSIVHIIHVELLSRTMSVNRNNEFLLDIILSYYLYLRTQVWHQMLLSINDPK